MSKATKILGGITQQRIYREPLDSEAVILSYSDLKAKLEQDPSNHASTKNGALYGGMITSVISDNNNTYNGPWYITYNMTSATEVTYHGERMPLATEVTEEIDITIDDSLFTWGHLT